MHPDVHLVRTRPPILDVPPLVWIDPPGAPKASVPSLPLWEWPAPPQRPPRRFPLLFVSPVVGAVMGALAFTFAYEPDLPEVPAVPLPVPDEPIYCACVWWPSGPAPTLS